MAKNNGNIFEIKEETNEVFSNDDLFNINSWGADPSVRELIEQYKEGDIALPELQRKYVWNKKTASRFIESVLLGLPVPSIFLAQKGFSGKRIIIDGYQRIRTLHDYILDGIWHGDESTFSLLDTELINERWRGKTYKGLSDEDKRRLKLYTIHAIIFEQKHPKDDTSLFQIFERINTSGVTLNDQEVRNCVYQGDMNSLLFKLNDNPNWRKLFGTKDGDSRMKDLELILRFFAMNKEGVYNSEKHAISLKQLLNEEMSKHRNDKEYCTQRMVEFEKVIEFIYEHFGEDAFYNLQNDLIRLRKRLYPTVYDSLMIATSIAMSKGISPNICNWKERRLRLVRDEEYRECITQGTMQVDHIRKRISKALEIIYDMQL